jgi:hypothetical protein
MNPSDQEKTDLGQDTFGIRFPDKPGAIGEAILVSAESILAIGEAIWLPE